MNHGDTPSFALVMRVGIQVGSPSELHTPGRHDHDRIVAPTGPQG